jgi:hypothetical protein
MGSWCDVLMNRVAQQFPFGFFLFLLGRGSQQNDCSLRFRTM